jgi:hypothetical protein
MGAEGTTTSAPPPAAQAKPALTTVGVYHVKKGKSQVAFWPVSPDFIDVVFAAPKLEYHTAPSVKGKKKESTTLIPPPQFGIFDIVVRLSGDKSHGDKISTGTIEDADHQKKLSIGLQGKPTLKEMELVPDKDGDCRICFAVHIPLGETKFDGTLSLQTTLEAGQKATAELPIHVEKSKRADDMFVFFIAHSHAKTKYCWCKLKTVAAKDSSALGGVSVKAKILRDNGSFKALNRRVDLTSFADGFIGYKQEKRKVLGFPTEWPLIFNATSGGCVDRGHMFRFAKGEAKDNTDPIAAPPERINIRLTKIADAKTALANTKIMLDPGHGVAYVDQKNRRCQEWLSASRLADRIRATLRDTFGIPEANIFQTRTAGIALIVPSQVNTEHAPESGAKLFTADFTDSTNRKASVKSSAAKPTLNGLADLLLTGDDDTPAHVSASRRLDLIRQNADTMKDVVDTTIQHLKLQWEIVDGTFAWNGRDAFTFNLKRTHPHKHVAPDVGTASIGWDGSQYMCTVDSDNLSDKESHTAGGPFPVLINSDNDFRLDDAMLDNLISRTARWSIAKEVGSSDVVHTFTADAREAMKNSGALDYMKRRIRAEIDIGKDVEGVKSVFGGWTASHRMTYFNEGPACHFYLTMHENAGGGIGGCVLIQRKDSTGSPPDDQIRNGKIWIKYLDPFDQGVRQGGLAPEAFKKDGTLNKAGMLRSGNHKLTRFAYFELEFMDTYSTADPAVLQYQLMLQDDYFGAVSSQIVAGLIEALLDKQDMGEFDKMFLKGEINDGLW